MTGNPEVILLCSVKSDFRNVRHPHLRLTPSVVLMVTWAEVCSTGIMLRSRYCNQSEVCMEYDEDKVDEMVLALLHLTTFTEGMGIRAWKGHDWNAMDRLYKRGYISDPQNAAKSVRMTESGAQKAQE